MSRRLKQAAVALAVVFAAAQLVRPGRANPPIDASRTIQAHVGTASGLSAVLDRACGQCHSNATVWPWYTNIAPLSWLMAAGVREGRKVVNFSEWAGYPPEHQRALLVASCQDASSGKMPGSAYTLMYPETRLSPQDVETICAAARQAEATATGGRGGGPASLGAARVRKRVAHADQFRSRWSGTFVTGGPGRPQWQPRDDADRRLWRELWVTWS